MVIPKANVPDLMLKGQIIDAVRQGKFAVYAVEHADEALEILTGVQAGVRQEDGTYPEDTLNWLVEKKLKELTEKAMKFMKDGESANKTDQSAPGGCNGCGQEEITIP